MLANIINKSLISVITPISLDHQYYLGNNVEKIAKEKLGIIKKNSLIISSKQTKKVIDLINKFSKNNKLISYGKDWKVANLSNSYFQINYEKHVVNYPKPSLIGNHQIYNASTAIIIINNLKKMNYNFDNKIIKRALKNTRWPGRLEKIKNKKFHLYLDGSHNIDGIKSLIKFILKTNIKTWVILGMLNTKDIESCLNLLKKNIVGIVALDIPNEKNTLKTKEIRKICDKLKIFCLEEKNINSALSNLEAKYKPKQVIVTGSLYLIGKIRKKLINY